MKIGLVLNLRKGGSSKKIVGVGSRVLLTLDMVDLENEVDDSKNSGEDHRNSGV